MKTDQENSTPAKLTIFKPPRYIYKLSKGQKKNILSAEYETYFNDEYSLRKYHRMISIYQQSELALY